MHTRIPRAIPIRCYLTIKTTIYTEDTMDIRRRKVTRNNYKYDLQAPNIRRKGKGKVHPRTGHEDPEGE